MIGDFLRDFWWFLMWFLVGTGESPPYCNKIPTKAPLEKLDKNLGLADPPPPQLGENPNFFPKIRFEGSPKRGRGGYPPSGQIPWPGFFNPSLITQQKGNGRHNSISLIAKVSIMLFYLQVTLRTAPWTVRCRVCRSPLLLASLHWHTVSIFLINIISNTYPWTVKSQWI